jgi:DNA-binding CsgD family transcriptional regulator
MRVKGTDKDAVRRLVNASGDVADYARLYPATPARVTEIVAQVADTYAAMGINLVFEVAESESVRIDRLRTSFGLTLAEATLALYVGCGGQLRTYAEQRKLSRNTVRNQLQQVFDKVGVSRQADLVARLRDL